MAQQRRYEIPPSVTALVKLMKQEPLPTELDIAVLLHMNDNDNDNDNDNAEQQENEMTRTRLHNAFVKVDTHLGINAADLPLLAREFRAHYNTLRCLRNKCNDDGDVVSLIDILHLDMMDATMCLLCVCPDHSTAWADRCRSILFLTSDEARREQEEKKGAMFSEELQFLNLLFTRHSSK